MFKKLNHKNLSVSIFNKHHPRVWKDEIEMRTNCFYVADYSLPRNKRNW